MKIIFKKDGSIYYSQLDEYINQNSTGVNSIFVTILQRDIETYTCSANFLLPNGASNKTSGVKTEEEIDGKTYQGYTITLNSAQTAYSGNLKMSIELYDNGQNRLWAYPVSLVVNPTMQEPSSTITNEEYNALLSTLAQYQLAFIDHNMRSYTSFEQAVEDIDKLTDNQIIAIQTETGLWGLYKKENETFVGLTVSGLATDAFLRKAEAKLDVSTNGIGLKGIPTSYDKTRIHLDNAGNIVLIPNDGAGVVVGDANTVFSAIYKDSLGAVDRSTGRSAYYKNDRISYSTGADAWFDLYLADIINKQVLDDYKQEVTDSLSKKVDKIDNTGNSFNILYGVANNSDRQATFNTAGQANGNTIVQRLSQGYILGVTPFNDTDFSSVYNGQHILLNKEYFDNKKVFYEDYFGTDKPGFSEVYTYVNYEGTPRKINIVSGEPGSSNIPGYNAEGKLYGNTTSDDEPKVLANKQYVDNAISSVLNGAFQIVETLPETGKQGVIYAVPMEDNPSVYELYVWEDNSYKSLGKTEIDLSNYYNKTEVDDKLRAKLTIPTTNPGAKRPTYLPVLNFSTGDVYTTSFVNVDSTTNGNTIVMRDNNGDVLVKDNPTTEQGAINQKHLTDTLGGYLTKEGSAGTYRDRLVMVRRKVEGEPLKQVGIDVAPNFIDAWSVPTRRQYGQILGGQSPDDEIEDNELLNYKYVSTHYVPFNWTASNPTNIPYVMETLKQEDGTFKTQQRRVSSYQDAYSLPYRTSTGNINVALEPDKETSATSKAYVDTKIASVESEIKKINYGYLAKFYGAPCYRHTAASEGLPNKNVVFTVKEKYWDGDIHVFASFLGQDYCNHYRRNVNFNKEPWLNVKALKKTYLGGFTPVINEQKLTSISVKQVLQWLFNNTTDIDWANVDESTLTAHTNAFMLSSYNNKLEKVLATTINGTLKRANIYGNYDRPITDAKVQNGGCITLSLFQGKTLDDLLAELIVIQEGGKGSACAHFYNNTLAVYNIALHFAVNDTLIPTYQQGHRNNIVITLRCNLLISPTAEQDKYYCDFKFQRLDK